jgi:hypothetical protein
VPSLYLEVVRFISFTVFIGITVMAVYTVRKKLMPVGHVAPGLSLGIHGILYVVCFWLLNPVDPALFNAWSATLRLHAILVVFLPVLIMMLIGGRPGAKRE